ncbi:VOC family protein [Streptomyces capillispiralis]|uniref:Extradiol dioxygenase family protein n=1 Tax=Streptomyces capillispiralis TaxID=68182 RepID=A0A561T8T7_9ACTN|nr:VOC family protein [Streptomyces capillispiralis]TWF83532.1 extradiol dioxygenase family protein [Streptomyces capillispiralis]GHH91678.1 glyoxalase [Streptomyces capillispiralis]
MSVELNHTIVLSRDREESARFFADILGLEVGQPAGVFLPVTTANGVTLDFATVGIDIPAQHYAFLVSEDEFDAILARLVAAGVPIQADPHGRHPGRINRNDGGRGVYFHDPAGHGLEALTRPYGTDPASPLNGVTEAVPGAV